MATYILNRVPCSQTTGSTPYEIWTGRKLDLWHVRIFGPEAFAHVPKQLRDKLDAKAKKMLLVGYKGDSAGYRLYDSETKRVSEVRDVIFNEKKICSTAPIPDSGVSWPDIPIMEDDEKGQNELGDEPEKQLPGILLIEKTYQMKSDRNLHPLSSSRSIICEIVIPSNHHQGIR